MNFTSNIREKFLTTGLCLLAPLTVFFSQANSVSAKTIIVKNKSNLGVIKGVVRDEKGSPISNAIVALFKPGVEEFIN